jgi:hypothetical protein
MWKSAQRKRDERLDDLTDQLDELHRDMTEAVGFIRTFRLDLKEGEDDTSGGSPDPGANPADPK